MIFWRKLWTLFSRNRLEREMNAEMQAHLDGLAERHRAEGIAPEEARYAAVRDFGGVEQIKEQCRDERGGTWLRDLGKDLRYGFRQMRRAPGFSVVAVLTLAIGIGATTAMFSIVNGVVLQPLPFREPDRLVALRETSPHATMFAAQQYPTRLTYQAWKEQATLVEHLVASSYWQCILTGAGEPTRHYGWRVSKGFFDALGVQAIRGRTFRPEESTPGRDQVVVISYRVWMNYFEGSERVIGRSVQINDRPYTIVGVLPPRFLPEPITDPAMFSPDTKKLSPETRAETMMSVIGRLKPAVTIEQASGELNLISARLAQEYPDLKKGWGARAMWLLDAKVGEARPLLFILLGAVGLLLLIACFNVANLLLARASSRTKEISIRAALGARRGRIIRQLLSESLVLAVAGTVLGVALAHVGLQVLLQHAPLSLPRTKEVAVDGVVLLFSCGLAVATGVGFGLMPALHATRGNLAEAMNDASRGSSVGGHGLRLRNFLVVFEVALALVLLVMAVLLMHSFARLKQIPLGYQTGHAYVSRIYLQESRYPTTERKMAFVRSAVERLSAAPGVEAVVFSNRYPSYGWSERAIAVASRPDLDPKVLPQSSYYTVTTDYFRAIDIKLGHGRLFDAHDLRDSEPVAIVSEGFVAKYFPGVDPLGQRITILGAKPAARRIVGVVGTVRDFGPITERPFQVYVPLEQDPSGSPHLLVGVNRSFAGLLPALRRAMDLVDPDMPLAFNGIDLEGFLNETIAPQRYALFLFGVFAGVALLLCAMGIYSVVAFTVARRTQEIGIRMALGAQPSDILRLVFVQNGRMVGCGIAIGLAGSLAATRLVGSLLVDVSPYDPLAFTGAACILSAVALLACYVPARRAIRIDPNTALRYE